MSKTGRVVGDGTPGPGRPKGLQNKFTRGAKEAFALAFEGVGGVERLTEWARENLTDFYKLYARLIPVELNAHVEHVVSAKELTDDQLAAIAAGRGAGTARASESPRIAH